MFFDKVLKLILGILGILIAFVVLRAVLPKSVDGFLNTTTDNILKATTVRPSRDTPSPSTEPAATPQAHQPQN